jgi:ketosteroid isomerase-like protein
MRNIVAIAMLVFIGAGTAFAECSASDRAALEAFDRAWGEASTSGNKDALMAIYADDYYGLPAGQSKQAVIDAAIAGATANKANPNPDKVTHEHYYISCTPNSALITHRNTIWTAEGEGGKPETFYTRSVHGLEKRNGKWLVVSNAGNNLDEYETLWYLEQDWNDATWHKDRSWFEKNYAPDFYSVSSSTAKVMNRKADIDDTVNDKGTFDMVETTGMNIRMNGDTAQVTGIFHLKGKDEKGAAFDRKIRYIDTWIKKDGRWWAWSSQGTTIPAGQ